MQRIRGSTRMRYTNLLLLTYLLTGRCLSSLDQIVRGSLCDHGDREIRFFAWLCRAGHGAVISATLFLPTQILDAFWQLYRRRRRSLTLLTRLLAPIDLAVSSHPMPPRPAPRGQAVDA